LRKVQKSPTQGYQVRVRRALSMDEIHSLLASSGERALPYMMALFTGLRRGEMRQLQWADVKLEDKVPVLQVRAATTKNRQSAVIPLTAPLAEALRRHCGPDSRRTGLVFPRGVVSAKALAKDLQVCGDRREG
jgi:integrase